MLVSDYAATSEQKWSLLIDRAHRGHE